MPRRSRRLAESISTMASLPPVTPIPAASSTSVAARDIPLECMVCPQNPRFSDVSHLLTHIASKGHLHYETQTKLKAYGSNESAMILDQYQKWYTENGIHLLLVERLKAKEVKEAARNKRNRAASANPQQGQSKKKAKRSNGVPVVKTKDENLAPDFVTFNNPLASDDVDMQDDMFSGGDMLSLKGQIWPGMGKMDLANEEMKRTRNQRKPVSVVDKMRRTSEGIAPTEVVMTSDLIVERIKGVYDAVSDVEDASPPQKVTRQRRKKSHVSQPLAEISANIPRGDGRQGNTYKKAPKSKSHDQGIDTSIHSQMGMFRPPPDIFRDDDDNNNNRKGMYVDGVYSTPIHHDQRFDLRDRYDGPASHSLTHSGVVSPTPSTRDGSSHHMNNANGSRGRFHGQSYMSNSGHFQFGSFGHPETPYSMESGSMCYSAGRLPFSTPTHYDTLGGQEQYRLPASAATQPKHTEYGHANSDESMNNTGANLFLSVHGGNPNPLFSQERFLNPYGQSTSNHSLTRPASAMNDAEQRLSSTGTIKHESRLCESFGDSIGHHKEASFDPKELWQGQDRELDGLRTNELGM